MAEQLILDLPFRAAMGREDFLISAANAGAVAGIDGWAGWPHGKSLLVGPEASGKTHLAHVWADRTGAEVVMALDLDDVVLDRLIDACAVVVEDLHRMDGTPQAETALFHLLNALVGAGRPVLMTSRLGPGALPVGLPDLASRIAQAQLLTLDPPDDALLAAVMVKLAQDRGLRLTPGMLDYALPRFERSFAAARDLVDRLNALSLEKKQSPSRAHLKMLFDADRGEPTDPDPAP